MRYLAGCALAATLALSACTVAKFSGRGPVPLVLNQPRGDVEVIEQVRATKRLVFDYTSAVDASEVLAEVFERTKADAIINLTFTMKNTAGDFFINLFTLGLANSRTVEITGTAVRMRGPSRMEGRDLLLESRDLGRLTLRLFSLAGPGRSYAIELRDGFYRLLGPGTAAEAGG